MNAHFASRYLDAEGTGSVRPTRTTSRPTCRPPARKCRASSGWPGPSRLYRELGIPESAQFSRNGDDRLGTIGNASTAEGMFWESLNAGGVLGIPMIVSIWDDGYGISVPNEFQITKGKLSELLKGFQRDPKSKQGYDLYTVKGWDYPALCETYISAAQVVRMEHVPAIIHVIEVTQRGPPLRQPRAHKSAERLGGSRVRRHPQDARLMIAQGIATRELDDFCKEDVTAVRDAQRRA